MTTSQNQISKAVSLSMLIKADLANPNAGWGEGNITVMKKVSLNDGAKHPYISGQALRRYLRDTLTQQEIVPSNSMSPLREQDNPKAPILTEGKPTRYFDDDLFGFLGAVKGETYRRESPLRVSAAFGIFPYEGDRDLGTRSTLAITSDPEAGGAMFETEVTHNVFRTTWLLELDRVGCGKNYETTDSAEDIKKIKGVAVSDIKKKTRGKGQNKKEYDVFSFSLSPEERKRRVVYFLNALKYYRGGARCGRLLLDFVPRFIVYFRLIKKLPLLLNDLTVKLENGKYSLEVDPIKEIVRDYKNDIQKCVVGYRRAFLNPLNLEEVFGGKVSIGKENSKELPYPVFIGSVGDAIDEMVKDIASEGVNF